MHNDIEYVDLGLPSGTLWAKYNIGATSETEYGGYYKYGRTTTGCSVGQYYGTENPLAASADVVTQTYGDRWHTPTSGQCQELIDNTTYTWETNFNGSGINGLKMTSKTKPNVYLFLPAGGRLTDGCVFENVGTYGYFLTNTPYDSENFCGFYIYSKGPRMSNGSTTRRRIPRMARGVKDSA